jgi:dolichyl-phosphooligosaccharide-protein glycotransferase
VRRNQIVLLIFAVILGFAIRAAISTFDAPDGLYHLRRATFALEHFPRTIVFDPLINFPEGGVVIWPPLFDLTLALPALVLGGTDADLETLKRTAIWVPPLYAALTIALVGVAGIGIWRRWGASAAVVVAVLPGHVEYSMLGRTDQHVAESFWAVAVLASLVWAEKRESPWLEAVGGVCIAASVLNWQGGIFWAPVVALPLVVGALRGRDPHGFRRVLLLLGLPSVLVAFATGYWLQGFPLPFTYVSFGWFQPVFLALVFLLTGSVVLITRALRKEPVGTEGIVVLAGMAVSAASLTRFGSDLFSQVLWGLTHLGTASEGRMTESGAYLSYPSAWLSRIREYDPLLADGAWSLSWLSFAFFVAPVAIVRWGRKYLSDPRMYHYGVIASWGIFILFFTLSQRRNVYYAAILTALAAVEISSWAGVHLRKRFLNISDRRRSATPLFIAVFLCLLAPVLVSYPSEVTAGYAAGERATTFEELGRIATRQIDPYDPRFLEKDASIPELERAESVLAFWSQGHLATWYSGLPVVANNFGYGYVTSLEFYFSEDESEAVEIAKRHRVRWVVVFDLLSVFESYGEALGETGYVSRSGSGFSPTPRYFRTLHARLYESDGLGGVVAGLEVEPLDHFRLLWHSDETVPRPAGPVPRFKIFELLDPGEPRGPVPCR